MSLTGHARKHIISNKNSLVILSIPWRPYLPGHGDQVAKPLMSQLMSNNHCHPLLGTWRRMVAVIHECCFPIGDEPPVLHGTSTKVWDSYQVCRQWETGTFNEDGETWGGFVISDWGDSFIAGLRNDEQWSGLSQYSAMIMSPILTLATRSGNEEELFFVYQGRLFESGKATRFDDNFMWQWVQARRINILLHASPTPV